VSAPDLWVLGNLTIDDLVLPTGETSMGLCGGNGIFAALGGRVWSDHVGLSARIGPDFPRANIRALEAAGVQLELCEVDAPTIHSWALYESPDRRRFINWLDSGSHLEQSLLPADVPAQAGQARVCHIAPMPAEVQIQLVHYLAPLPGLVSLDPHDEYIVGARDQLLELLRQVDLFLPSRQEAALLYGRDDPEAAARAFAQAGPRVVAIKLGTDGSLVWESAMRDPLHIPVVAVDAIDPTGAGDAYCGAFCVTYAHTHDAIESALRATVAGSLMVERRGALAVLPFDRTLIEQRLTSLRNRTETEHPCAWKTAS
jgi:ribokinase